MDSKHAAAAPAAPLGASASIPATGHGRATRTAQAGPVAAMIAQVLLLAAVAEALARRGVALSAAGWIVGVGCAVVTNALLARGLAYYRADRLGLANSITLARATLAVGVAALVADSFENVVPVAMLVSLTAVALALDFVDGWVARRTRTTAALGARFDAEVDAFLIAVLSVYVARSAGAWVLAIGSARYAFLVAGWTRPWLRQLLPPRYWRKVVAATQGIVLAIAAAHVLPPAATRAALLVALGLLAESFGRDVLWLWSHRDATLTPPPPLAEPVLDLSSEPPAEPRAGRGRGRTAPAAVLTLLALLLVWFALVAPDQPGRLEVGAFLRLPLEGLVVVALALVLRGTGRRVLAAILGPFLALMLLVKILDVGFFTAFDRPFNLLEDPRYTGIGIETMRASIGHAEADLVVAGVAVFIVALLALMTVAVLRVGRVAAGHRRGSLRAVAAFAAVWVLCWAFGARLVAGTPIASTSAAALIVREVSQVRTDVQDHGIFGHEITRDRFRYSPGTKLLTALRGKDVLLTFVESYGQVAVQGTSFSRGVDRVLASGTRQLQSAGFSARSAWLTSPTYGGISWLAHSTMQTGLWVDSEERYDQLVKTDRFTLSTAFKRAGWRTVYDVPADDRTFSPATTFYHYDKIYDRRNVGYRGPKFAYAPMPDQYVYSALQRLELGKRHRRPLFAEIDTVSSHEPWTRIPKLIAWSDVGDGSIFKRAPTTETTTRASLFGDPTRVQKAYGQSVQYSLNTLVSFVRHSGDRNLVLIVLGDHQPWRIISGDANHDVPVSVIARDPAVFKRISGWGWNAGLRPSRRAPVWRMNAFRDRFLTAFGSQPASR